MVIHPELTRRLLEERERQTQETLQRSMLIEQAKHAGDAGAPAPAREPLKPLPKPQPATHGC